MIFSKLSALMPSAPPTLPLVSFDPISERMTYTPVGTRENAYKPQPVNLTGQAMLIESRKLDYGWRCYPIGSRPKEVIARAPAPFPDKPTDVHKNTKGDAQWQMFVRLGVAVDKQGKANLEIDERHGGRAMMLAIEALVEGEDDTFVVRVKHGTVETADGPYPVLEKVTNVDGE